MNLPARYFRAGVGAVIVNARGLVLALEREQIPGAWQLPQGGWETGESAEEAMFREVEEETGLSRDRLDLVGRCPEPMIYELPEEWQTAKTGLGQVQYWYLLRLHETSTEIRLPVGGEFRAWIWLSMEELIERTVYFRQGLYRRLQRVFKPRIDEVVAGNLGRGSA